MLTQDVRRWWRIVRQGLICLGALGLLVQCTSSGDSGNVSSPTSPSPRSERQAIESLLEIYRTAFRHEDIDRLQELLQGEARALQCRPSAPGQTGDDAFQDVETFCAAMSTTFRAFTILDLQIPATWVQIPADQRRVTFVEVESVEDPTTLTQRTRLFRTTWHISRVANEGAITFRIGEVRREGPLVQVTTPGQVQAGTLKRVMVHGTETLFPLTSVEVQDTEHGRWQALAAADNSFHGVFTPSPQGPPCLPVRLREGNGEELMLDHCYRRRRSDDGVLQRVAGTDVMRVFAVAIGRDGTIWAGGDATRLGTIGTIIHLRADGDSRQLFEPALPPDPDHPLPEETRGRIEDIAVDQQGRVHFVFLARIDPQGVVASGDVVWDPRHPEADFCQTVNVADDAYPFRAPRDREQRSPSTRVVAADGGAVWLTGSDDGVGRVEDDFQDGECPPEDVGVRYGPIYRRGESGLLANTVPALVVGRDDTLWFGTALGLMRLQHGQFTPVPFDPALSLQGDVATLEAFFQQVAEAIFQARPLTAVAFNGVSFVEAFGRAPIKGDFIWSAAEDTPNRLWVGALGGGLRRIEGARQTRHLTRQDGLASDIILALAMAPDGALWVATDDGVSRLQAGDGDVRLTTFAALDGLPLPVRDVAIDRTGMAWLATDGGLFRLLPQGGQLVGVVRGPNGQPVAGVDVRLLGTPFQTVTDAAGRYTLRAVPPGAYRLEVDGRLATEEPFTRAERDVEVTAAVHTMETIIVEPSTAAVFLERVAGDGQTGVVGQPLPQPLRIAARDAAGQPVPHLPLTFTVTRGEGHLTGPQPLYTDAQGQAAVDWTLGIQADRPGVVDGQRVEVTGPGLAPLILGATAVADRNNAELREVSGNNQRGLPEEILEPLVVRLEDQFGNPLVGEVLRAEILRGGVEFVEGNTQETNANGEAQFRVRVTTDPGVAVVDVTVPALPQVERVRFLLNRTRFAVGNSPSAVAVADFTGDGVLDVVTANAASDDVSILRGRGDGTFEVTIRLVVGDYPEAVAVGDFTGDEVLDVVTANTFSNDISILLGLGDGTFE